MTLTDLGELGGGERVHGLESDKPARTFTVWLSDDGDRVPLKVTAMTELGEVSMDLTEYNRP